MLRRVLAATVILLLAAAGRADALTMRDVIELSKAGLSDAVLLALIEVDRSVFSIDTATLKELKTAGVSDAVIVAMIRSGRQPQTTAPAQPVAPEPRPAPEPDQTFVSAAEAAPAAQTAPAPEPAGGLEPAPGPYAFPAVIPVYVAVPVLPVVPVHGTARRAATEAKTDVPPNCLTAQIPIWGFRGKTQPQERVCH
jgi:hypothetical protein